MNSARALQTETEPATKAIERATAKGRGPEFVLSYFSWGAVHDRSTKGVEMQLPRLRQWGRKAVVALCLTAVLAPLVYFICLLILVYHPRTRIETRWAVQEYMSSERPNFKSADYDMSMVSTSREEWEIRLVHRATGERICVRWVDTFPYGFMELVDCAIRDDTAGKQGRD
jgi:hypothetical protein